MLKSNTAREIFYIFLWLGGIILLYALVEMYILEPSHYNSTTSHTEQLVENHTNSAQHTTENMSKVHTTNVVKIEEKTDRETLKTVTPVVVTKVTHKVEKLAVNDKVVALKTETGKVITQKKSVPDIKKDEKVSANTPVVVSTKKETKTIEKVVQKKTISPVQALVTPSVPEVVSMPKSVISIPSTPSIPSVPTMPNSHTVNAQKTTVAVKEPKQMHETAPVTKELKKVLSRDEEMKLIETARQHVIEKAEAAREEAMKALER